MNDKNMWKVFTYIVSIVVISYMSSYFVIYYYLRDLEITKDVSIYLFLRTGGIWSLVWFLAGLLFYHHESPWMIAVVIGIAACMAGCFGFIFPYSLILIYTAPYFCFTLSIATSLLICTICQKLAEM